MNILAKTLRLFKSDVRIQVGLIVALFASYVFYGYWESISISQTQSAGFQQDSKTFKSNVKTEQGEGEGEGEGELVSQLPELAKFELLTLEGNGPLKVSAKSFLDKSDKIFIHFWATWCVPCESELPSFLAKIKSEQKLNNKKSLYYLIAVQDEKNKVIKKIKSLIGESNEITNSIILLLDNSDQMSQYFGTSQVPETFVFEKNGKIFRHFVGPQDWARINF